MANEDGRAFVERYVAAYNNAATEQLSEAETKAATLAVFEEFYDPDLTWSEAPTSLFPAGRGGGRAQMAEAVALVSSMLSWRRYEIVGVVSEGDRVAAAYVWQAGYRSGEGMLHIDLAAFYRIKDGRFAEILEYPCIGTTPGSTP